MSKPLSLEEFVRSRYPAPAEPGPEPSTPTTPDEVRAYRDWKARANDYGFFKSWGYEDWLIKKTQYNLEGLMALSGADYSRYLLKVALQEQPDNPIAALRGRPLVRAEHQISPFLQPRITRGTVGIVIFEDGADLQVLFPAWWSAGLFGSFSLCSVSAEPYRSGSYPFDERPANVTLIEAAFESEDQLRGLADLRYVAYLSQLERQYIEELPELPGPHYVLKVYDQHSPVLIVADAPRPLGPLKLPKRWFSTWSDAKKLPEGVRAVELREAGLNTVRLAQPPSLEQPEKPAPRRERRAATVETEAA
jgi:hypothetical protein